MVFLMWYVSLSCIVSGLNCEEEIDECEIFQPCINADRCIDLVNGFECDCSAGWTGRIFLEQRLSQEPMISCETTSHLVVRV